MPTLQEIELRASLARRDARILELEQQLEHQTFRADKFEGALKATQTSAAHIDRLKIASVRIQELERELAATESRLHEVAVGCATAEQQRDALSEALTGPHHVCELALAAPDGKQHVYFVTHHGCFVAATDAMVAAEAALADVKSGA